MTNTTADEKEKCSICQDKENLEKITLACIEFLQNGDDGGKTVLIIIDGKNILIERCFKNCPCENNGVIFTCICDHVVKKKRKNIQLHFLCNKNINGEIQRINTTAIHNRPFAVIQGNGTGVSSTQRKILENYTDDCENYEAQLKKAKIVL